MEKVKHCPFCGRDVIVYKGLMGIKMFRCTNTECGAVVSFNAPKFDYKQADPVQQFNRRFDAYLHEKPKKG